MLSRSDLFAILQHRFQPIRVEVDISFTLNQELSIMQNCTCTHGFLIQANPNVCLQNHTYALLHIQNATNLLYSALH